MDTAVLGANVARPEHVEAHAGDDGRHPAAQVLDAIGTRPAEPNPAVLNGFLRLGERAQHPVGDGVEVRSMLLEAPRQPLVLIPEPSHQGFGSALTLASSRSNRPCRRATSFASRSPRRRWSNATTVAKREANLASPASVRATWWTRRLSGSRCRVTRPAASILLR